MAETKSMFAGLDIVAVLKEHGAEEDILKQSVAALIERIPSLPKGHPRAGQTDVHSAQLRTILSDWLPMEFKSLTDFLLPSLVAYVGEKSGEGAHKDASLETARG